MERVAFLIEQTGERFPARQAAKTQGQCGENHDADGQKRSGQSLHNSSFARIRALPGNQQFGEGNEGQHVSDPGSHGQDKETDPGEHGRIVAGPNFVNSDSQEKSGHIREVDANLLISFQVPVRGIDPKIDMNVKQKRVGKRNTDDGYRVCNSQQGGPVVETKPKQPMQSNNQVAAVPPAHTECQGKQDPLDWTQTSPPGNQLNSHPQR